MALTIYRIREFIDGERAEDPIVALRSVQGVDEHLPEGDWDFSPRLFLARSTARFPDWAQKLTPHFQDGIFRRVRGAGAVLFVRAPGYPGVWFAFTWGQRGRHLLRPDAFVRHFGLKAALNLIYGGKDDGGARVRSVDAKTVSSNTLRTRTQADRRAIFEDFGVDARRDLLDGITGRPSDADVWGPRVSGTDRLAVTRDIPFEEYGAFCDRAEEAHRGEHYKESFAWIDHLTLVADPVLAQTLLSSVLDGIQAGTSPLQLAIPEIIEWGDITRFHFSFDETAEFEDPEDADLSLALAGAGRLAGLSINGLRNAHRLVAVTDDGEVVRSWSVLKCLSGELEVDGDRYVLSEGDFFFVRTNLIKELADYVDALPTSAVAMPESDGDMREDVYNAHMVETVKGTLLLDKRTVRLPGATSSVEVCDVLSDAGNFIHVKRKLGSSQLSHLFSQGARSCELAIISPDFRRITLEKIAEVATESGLDPNPFRPFEENQVDSTRITVDYAIVARWRGRRPSEALPFFSQLNLRSFAEGIRSRRANVTLTPVEVIE